MYRIEMESLEMTDLYLDEIPEDLNQDNPFHINGFPREILIEIFRYIKTLEDRHNAMLVCKYWYEILQDPCFVVTCPEILTLKYYEITADCEPFKALYWSSRKFNQVRLNCLNWSDDDDQLLEQFFRHLGRDARIVYYTDSLEWKNFLTFFPKMTELRVDTLETLKPYTQFAVELHSVVVKNLDPKTVDLTMPIFSQIKSLKASTRFKIVPDHQVSSGLNILLDENLKFSLSKFCDLNDVRIVTGANLLRLEALSVQDIVELVIATPVQILIENLSCFTKLQKLTVQYTEDPRNKTADCKFGHEDTRCPSVKKVSFQLPRDVTTDFCKVCFETMLKSFPNLRSLKLENGQYPDRAAFLSLIAKYCPDLKVLKLLHKLSPHDHAIATPDGGVVVGLLKGLTKIHLYNLVLDLLRDWPPMMSQLKEAIFIFVRFPEELSSWKALIRNSPNIKKLEIRSRFGLVEIQDPIPSHRHIQEIVQGLKHLQELNMRFNKLTPESLEPIFTYNRTLKRVSFATMGSPKPIFKLQQVFELFKRISSLETFSLKFVYFVDGEYNEKCYDTFRWDYQAPRDHLSECVYQYDDVHASMAYIRAFLMPYDKTYKGHVNSLGSEDLSDVHAYLGVHLATEVAREVIVQVEGGH